MEESETRNPRRDRSRSAKDIMEVQVPKRAIQGPERLKANLTGSILLSIDDKGESYLFEWTQGDPKVQKVEDSPADCKIRMKEESLLDIYDGQLNPQIAMLSEKIKVNGKASLAIYFFNLVVPSSHVNP